MAYSEGLASRIRTVLSRRRGITGERQMFGGVCFTMNGHMVCGVVKDDLMVRVGPDAYEKSLRRAHARPMDFTGRPMDGFVYVAAAGLKSAASLKSWIGAGVAHARTLQPKCAEKAKGARPDRQRGGLPGRRGG
jgi:TfoX/Sxy family transcriptional regulator of competence genes